MSKFSHDADDARAMTIPRRFLRNSRVKNEDVSIHLISDHIKNPTAHCADAKQLAQSGQDCTVHQDKTVILGIHALESNLGPRL